MASRKRAIPPVGKPAPGIKADAELSPAHLDQVMECLNQQQFGDAKLLQLLYGDRLLYDPRERAFFYWNGVSWAEDGHGLVKQLLAGSVAAQYLLACAEITRKAVKLAEEKQKEQMALAKLLT